MSVNCVAAASRGKPVLGPMPNISPGSGGGGGGGGGGLALTGGSSLLAGGGIPLRAGGEQPTAGSSSGGGGGGGGGGPPCREQSRRAAGEGAADSRACWAPNQNGNVLCKVCFAMLASPGYPRLAAARHAPETEGCTWWAWRLAPRT
jgi:hypothetical protein